MIYEIISRSHPGWTYSDIREMPVRVRKYWSEVAMKLSEAKGA